MKQQKQSYIYATIAIILWSTVASAFKITLQQIDFIHLLFYSSITSMILLFLALLFQKKISLLKEYTKKEYLKSAIMGLLNPAIYYLILFKAYSVLPAQEAQPLNYTWPIMLVLLSIPLLKQKISIKSIIAIFISFFGVVIISTKGDIFALKFTNLSGIILALISAIIWALFWIINIKDKRDETAKLFLNFLFGTTYILVFILLFSKISLIPLNASLGTIYIGFFEMGITFLIWSKALKLTKTTSKISNLIYLVPFISLFIINIFVGEKILSSTIIGLIFIVLGIMLEKMKATQN